jgi:hypothetical protein
MTSPDTKPIAVLLVEDDPGDVVLIQEAFEHDKVRNTLHVVVDEFFVTAVELPGQTVPPRA